MLQQRRYSILLGLSFLCLLLCLLHPAKAAYAKCEQKFVQQIESENEVIGNKTICLNSSSHTKKEETNLSLRHRLFRYTLKIDEVYYYDNEGLKSVTSKIKRNKENLRTILTRTENGYQLEILEKKKAIIKSYSNNSYDMNSDEILTHFIQSQKSHSYYRTFNIDNFEIEETYLQRQTEEVINIQQNSYPAIKVIQHTGKFKSTLWVYLKHKQALVIKEKGVDEDGTYEINTVSSE